MQMLPHQSLQISSQQHVQVTLLHLCTFLDNQHLFNIKIWFSILIQIRMPLLTYEMPCYLKYAFMFYTEFTYFSFLKNY